MAARIFLQWLGVLVAIAFSSAPCEAGKISGFRGAAEPPRPPVVIDPQTPIKELLPALPETSPHPGVLNEDLALVPEVMFARPLAKNLSREKALDATEILAAKINLLNQKSEDGFIKALALHREDLRGLPFLLGEACRTDVKQARRYSEVTLLARDQLNAVKFDDPDAPTKERKTAEAFWARFLAEFEDMRLHAAVTPVLMQMHAFHSEPFRLGMVEHLNTIRRPETTRALAMLALFSPEEKVQAAAIAGLKLRKAADYADVLVAGLRYPWPAVTKRAADALAKTRARTAIGELVRILDEPDPRAPIKTKSGYQVRELVRINHHHNCLLCHAPATSDTPPGVLTAPTPLPGQPFPAPSSGGYYQPTDPNIVVRADMTYLRQDFSVMMKVKNAGPWPEMQRFDFFVRTRAVSATEAASITRTLATQTPPSRIAAHAALRELTGRSPNAVTAAAWRQLLEN